MNTINPYRFATAGVSLVGLEDWSWNLDESSDGSTNVTRVAATGGADLSSVATVPSSTDGTFGEVASFNDPTDADEHLVAGATTVGEYGTSTPFTFACWVYPTISEIMCIASKCASAHATNGWHIEWDQTNTRIQSKWNNAGAATSSANASVPINTWTLVGMSFDGTAMTVYTNDDTPVVGSDFVGGPTATSTYLFHLGSFGGWAGYEYRGLISRAAFFNKQLSAGEFSSLYNAGTPLGFPLT